VPVLTGGQCDIHCSVPVLTLNTSDMTYSDDVLCPSWNFAVGAFVSLRDKIVLA
jgi:hypothetical protein